MPYYRRRIAIKAAGKQHYSTQLQQINGQIQIAQGTGMNVHVQHILANNVNQAQFIPPMMKVKHVRVQFQTPPIPLNAAQIMNWRVFVMFAPEGYDVGAGQFQLSPQGHFVGPIADHPEYIMGWGNIKVSSSESSYQGSIRCRLNRNLHSGDRIVAVSYIQLIDQAPAAFVIPLSIMYTYALRSN